MNETMETIKPKKVAIRRGNLENDIIPSRPRFIIFKVGDYAYFGPSVKFTWICLK